MFHTYVQILSLNLGILIEVFEMFIRQRSLYWRRPTQAIHCGYPERELSREDGTHAPT